MVMRGQAYTLEGLVSAVLVLTAALFALQAVTFVPTTPGTVDRDTRQQLSVQADDMLSAAQEEELLSESIRHWNPDADSDRRCCFASANYAKSAVTKEFGYGPNDPPGRFGDMLAQTFDQRGFSFNVYLEYRDSSGGTERLPLVRRGEPTDNAVTESYTVTLYDDMPVTRWDSGEKEIEQGGTQLGSLDNDEFYAANLPGPVFNVVRIEVTIW
jgi:hypothetical protein